VARAIMIEDVCGCSTQAIGGPVERVFCDDERLDEEIRQADCACKRIARAALEAMESASADRIAALEAALDRADTLAAAVRFGLTSDTPTVKRAWFFYKTGRDEPVGSLTFKQLDAMIDARAALAGGEAPKPVDEKPERTWFSYGE
jgi:hypothetical protein